MCFIKLFHFCSIVYIFCLEWTDAIAADKHQNFSQYKFGFFCEWHIINLTMALCLIPTPQMLLFSVHLVLSLIMKDHVENLYIFWRSVSVTVCSQSLPNRGMFHQRTPVLPARHIQDALLMWFSFEKNTRLAIVMTSPAVRCRRWLKSLFWLQEFCQWDARSWSRSLWSFWHPLELTNRPPSQSSTTCPDRGIYVPKGGCFPARCQPTLPPTAAAASLTYWQSWHGKESFIKQSFYSRHFQYYINFFWCFLSNVSTLSPFLSCCDKTRQENQ